MQEKIYPFVSAISSPIEKGAYISKICNIFGVSKKDVEEELETIRLKIELENKKISERQYKTSKRKHENNKPNLDIFSENHIINKTKKRILRHITAIYFWQIQLKEKSWLKDPENILKKIEFFTDKTFVKKILNLNKDIIDSLILEVELIYKEREKESLNFDLDSDYKRLKNILKKEQLSNLQKKLQTEKDSSKIKEILQQIQQINENK